MGNGSSVKMKIQSYYPSFTKSEKKIADYVLEYFNKIMYLSVTELAECVGVGETTIFRFCKSLGLKGFPEFKLLVAQDVVESKNTNQIGKQDRHYSEQIKMNIIERVNESYITLDIEKLQEAVKVIKNAKRIYFIGVGSSGISARIAEERLIRIGFTPGVATDAQRQKMMASILGKRDVLIALSISGETQDIVESVKIAKQNGVKVIGITSYLRSSLTQHSDIVLQTVGKEHLMQGGTISNSISQMYIIDLLVTGVALEEKEKAMKMREKTGRAIMDRFYSE